MPVGLTDEPIDTGALLGRVLDRAAGAGVLFVGTTREYTGGRRTSYLTYEAYRPMALGELRKLEIAARDRWPLTGCEIVHRLGDIGLAEVSVAIAVSSPHRSEAFAAGQWLIDQIKSTVPIWKQEHWDDGESEWIHPGVLSSADAGFESRTSRNEVARDA